MAASTIDHREMKVILRSTSSPSGVVIIGAGPSGMACAYTLAQNGSSSCVVDRDDRVGGLCQTIDFDGNLFDIGGHRFLSKSALINQLWQEILGNRLLTVKRLSRIYHEKKFLNYPLTFTNTFRHLGLTDSLKSLMSYLHAQISFPAHDHSLEAWIIRRFGKKLYETFFAAYTRKLWGRPAAEISADWAAQRLSGLSLTVALKNAALGRAAQGPKTLAEQFLYPRKGPGEFFCRLRELASGMGVSFKMSTDVVSIHHDGGRICAVEVTGHCGSSREILPVGYLFSSMPISVFLKSLSPAPPEHVRKAAPQLRFRSFISVNVIIRKSHLFPDQWIYVQAPEIRMGRIQNFKNWSPSMVSDPEETTLGLEYYCDEGDSVWSLSDADLIDMGTTELDRIGIASRRDFVSGFVVRRMNAYPMYSLLYTEALDSIMSYLSGFSNFQAMGRAGLFRYDNSDQAMLSGIEAAYNFLGVKPPHEKEEEKADEYLEA